MNEQMTYKNWLIDWLENKKLFVKESTYAAYSVIIANHLIPKLGDMPITKIDELIVQNTILWWLQNGRRDKRGGLSEKTVKDILMVLQMSLRDAYRQCQLPFQPLDISIPKTNRYAKTASFSKEEQAKLMQSIQYESGLKSLGILLCLYTGMRIGEICALTWEDININKKKIVVNKTIERITIKHWEGDARSKIILTTPKTPSSQREIPIVDFLVPLLKQNIADDLQAYFLTGCNRFMEPRAYRSYYERFLKRHEITYINFHGLRHTFATRCIESGADYKTVSELLGHASVAMTMNLYVHPHMEQKRKCIEQMALSL